MLLRRHEGNQMILTACFLKTNSRKGYTIIQCFAPTKSSKDENTDDFFKQIQNILRILWKNDISTVLGEFIDKIRSGNNGYVESHG
jgi:hypothetical protein